MKNIQSAWREGGGRERLAILSDIFSLIGVSIFTLITPYFTRLPPETVKVYLSLVAIVLLFGGVLIVPFLLLLFVFWVLDDIFEVKGAFGFLSKILASLLALSAASMILSLAVQEIDLVAK